NAAVLVATPEKRPLRVVIGARIKEGRKLDSALRDLHKNLPADQKKRFSVEWNHIRHGTARIHRVRVPDGEDAFYLALRDDMLAVSDKDMLEFLKATLDSLPGKEPPPTPLIYAHTGAKGVLAV